MCCELDVVCGVGAILVYNSVYYCIINEALMVNICSKYCYYVHQSLNTCKTSQILHVLYPTLRALVYLHQQGITIEDDSLGSLTQAANTQNIFQ